MKIDRQLRPALWVFSLLLLAAVFCDVIANGRPLYCRIDGQNFYPAMHSFWENKPIRYENKEADRLEQNQGWRQYQHYETVLFPLIPFSPGEKELRADGQQRAQPPGSLANDNGRGLRHWLGTDNEGRDVAAGMIAGARIALQTGLVAMGIAFSIGLFLGALAGFWGDDRLRIRRGQLWVTLLGLLVAWFYAFIAGPNTGSSTSQWIKNLFVFVGIIFIFNLLGRLLGRLPWFSKTVIVPADLLIMRGAEVFNALPKFIFLLIVIRLLNGEQTIWLMVALIGAFSWPGVASLVRAELLRVRALDFVSAARALGLSEMRVLIRHALPNAVQAAYIATAIGVASAILLEASLSFLGLSGKDMEGASWGMLLHGARQARERASPAFCPERPNK